MANAHAEIHKKLDMILSKLPKNGNGKISIREIAAWSTAIVTGLAAVVQYLK